MKLFPDEPDFDIGTIGFDDKIGGRPVDLLGRKPLGQKLTELVDRINQPLVIALDGGWGSGKSHFLKIWAGAHRKDFSGQAEVIYFDAFEHDYLDDPLVSLVSRLTSEKAEKTWSARAVSGIKKAAFPLAKIATRIGLAAATAGATELVGAVADAAIAKGSDVSDGAINEFWRTETSRIAAMQGFRDALKALTEEGEQVRKIVFIVDELDRCRPDYALSLLEIIKHFFAVPNVHFVLGVNIAALEDSVRARYGSGIDAALYLQKFIHLRTGFQDTPDRDGNGTWARYFDHIVNEMGLGENLQITVKGQLGLLAKHRPVSLRDIQRMVTITTLLPAKLNEYPWGYIVAGVTAIVAKVLEPKLYASILAGRVSIAELEAFFAFSQGQEEGSHFADNMFHCWSFLLVETPDPNTVEYMKRAFGTWGLRNKAFELNRFLTESIDIFHLPDDPSN